MRTVIRTTALALVAVATCALAALPARAADPFGRGYFYDDRFHHDRYYPRPGFSINVLPRGYVTVPWQGSHYYYHGGVWYRPFGSRYQIVQPPLGIGAPLLPPGYTTVWIGGLPYYYADGTYYLWEPSRRGYVVTTPPPRGESAATTASPAGEETYSYPKNGQSESQQSTDRYECHDWARGQTGYDPTQPGGGVDAAQADSKRADYQRAQKACLEGRGYSVR